MDKEDRVLLKACGEWLRSSSEWYELKVIERVMKTVARKTGWNTPCAFWGNTPLHAVCECGMDDLVELLLERGADINSRADSNTPLQICCRGRRRATAQLLLNKGADVNLCTYEPPLHIACTHNSPGMVEMLLDHGADIESYNSTGERALHRACFLGDMALATLLIMRGAGINRPNSKGKTPLYQCCKYGDRDMAQLLVRLGAECREIDEIIARGVIEGSDEYSNPHDDSDGNSTNASSRDYCNSPYSYAQFNGFSRSLLAERKKYLAWMRRKAFLAVLSQCRCLQTNQQQQPQPLLSLPLEEDTLVEEVLRVAHRDIASYI